MMATRNLEEAVKEKVSPLVEETMEKNLGLRIPQLGDDITGQILSQQEDIYVRLDLDFKDAKREFKKEFFKRELENHLGNVSQLAKVLDVDRRSVHRVIKDLHIDVDEVRSSQEERYPYLDEIDRSIRIVLDNYREVLHPQRMEQMYEQVSRLSRNIARFLPHKALTWKEAERDFERKFLLHVLEREEWNIAATAREIGLRQETLHRKIKKLELK